jgi:hypothetical protein
MAQVEASYLDALDSHFNDHLIPSLATGKGDVILAGGAAYLMRQALQLYFEDRGFFPRLSLAWEHQDALTAVGRSSVAGILRNAVDGNADDGLLWPVPGAARRHESDEGGVMTQNPETRPERIKLVYNAQFPASTAVVLEYLLRNSDFSSRTGRQEAMDAIMAFFHPLAETARGERSVSEVQDIARHCVERLLKQVDMLCTTYQISNPMVNVTSALSKDFRQLEAVLDQGFLRLAGVLQSGATLPQATVVPSIEAGCGNGWQ